MHHSEGEDREWTRIYMNHRQKPDGGGRRGKPKLRMLRIAPFPLYMNRHLRSAAFRLLERRSRSARLCSLKAALLLNAGSWPRRGLEKAWRLPMDLLSERSLQAAEVLIARRTILQPKGCAPSRSGFMGAMRALVRGEGERVVRDISRLRFARGRIRVDSCRFVVAGPFAG